MQDNAELIRALLAAKAPCDAGRALLNPDAERWPGWQEPCANPGEQLVVIVLTNGSLWLCQAHSDELDGHWLTDPGTLAFIQGEER